MDLRGSFKAEREECQRCPAKEGRYVKPDLKAGSRMLLVGERPGATEAELGMVFVGRAGTTLDRLLEAAGSHRGLVSVANTCACYLEGNPKPTPEEVQCCAGVLEAAIEAVQPNVIVALGGTALRRLTGKDKPTAWRGSILKPGGKVKLGTIKVFGPEVYKSGQKKGQLKPRKVEAEVEQGEGRVVVATIHPAELQYTGFLAYPLVVSDLRRARMLSEGTPLVEVGSTVSGSTSEPGRLSLLLEANEEVVVDVETDGIGGRLNLVGVSVGPEHGESFYPTSDVIEILSKGLREPSRTLIGHNLAYDVRVLRAHGVEVGARLWDTMHAAHFERPDLPEVLKPKALDTVASRLPGIYYRNWKQDFRDRTNPNGIRYNQLDCAYTFAAKQELDKRLAASGRQRHFENVLMKVLPVLIQMEDEGVAIDTRVMGELRERQEVLAAKLAQEWERVAPEVNHRSPKQLMDYIYGKLKLPIQYIKTEEGQRPSLDAASLEVLSRFHIDVPQLRVLLAIRHVEKILSTYLNLPLDTSGRLHAQYNLSGTIFGRLSSGGGAAGFNLQNIPRTGEGCPRQVEGCVCVRLRELFVADDGDLGVAVGDYSQIEYRLVALLGGESWLIEALRDPKFDLHQDTADKLGVSRSIGKTVNHASNYGAGAFKLSTVTKRPQVECQRFLGVLQSTRPNITRWQMELVGQARRYGYVSNPFGRRAYFRVGKDGAVKVPDVLAFPPQSTAAEMMLVALIRGHRAGLKLRWTVHDELGISVRRESDVPLLKEVMEAEHEELPGFKNPADIGFAINWARAKAH